VQPSEVRTPALTGRLLLAIETSGTEPSVALLRGSALVAERRAPGHRPGSETLLPAIDALLRRARCTVGEIEAFAVCAGPGSFTGLRVGIATVKGLAFGSSAPVAAVGTLAALALRAPRTRDPIVAVLDARREEVYAAGFARDGDEVRACGLPEGLYGAEEIATHLPHRCVLVGDGVAVCGQRVQTTLGSGVRFVAPPRGRVRARDVGIVGLRQLECGEGVAAADLVPRYVRRAEAEVRRTGERTESPGGREQREEGPAR
jgi:tRNA threonylcarbamoyladenosine biosynthesis protein TsaB